MENQAVVVPVDRSGHLAYKLLYVGFIVAPIIAGLDKFFNYLTTWEMYLSPVAQQLFPLPKSMEMPLAGVIEIAGGILVAIKPRIGAFVVAAWLTAIIVNLLLARAFYDIALRDLGLVLGALALGLLSGKESCCRK